MFAPNPRGVGKALRTLFRHLIPLMPDWKINLYTNRQGGPPPCGYSEQVRWIDVRGDRFNAWENVRLPLAGFTDRIGILHCPSQTAPALASCPVVLTVHDLIPLRIGDGWSESEVSHFRKILARSVAKARRVITVSEFTKQDLLTEFKVPKEKIDVVWWGVENIESPSSGIESSKFLAEAYGIELPFFVAFGGEAPRKNVSRILEAFSRFTNESTREAQLVLLGVSALGKKNFSPIIEKLGIAKKVILLGYLDDATVAEIMRRAEALVYTSLYEGFGLPILEAMIVGTPVITSNVTSLPEVAGDAALLVDPSDCGAIADGMRECFETDRVRTELKARGLRRVKDFAWEGVARQTLSVYEKAL